MESAPLTGETAYSDEAVFAVHALEAVVVDASLVSEGFDGNPFNSAV